MKKLSFYPPPTFSINRAKSPGWLWLWLALILLFNPLSALAAVCGATWAPQLPNNLRDVTNGIPYSPSNYVAVGANATIITSPDAKTWTPRNAGVSGITLYSVANGNVLVAVGAGGTILTSSDGITWTNRTNPSITADLYKVIWAGASQFVAVGGSGTILTSPNGITWTQRTSGTSSNLFGIAQNVSLVTVGQAGTILASSDGGISWAAQPSGTTNTLYSVTLAGFSGFVAVGNQGTILSYDGSSWTPQSSPTSNHLFSVSISMSMVGNGYRAVGTGGTILNYDGMTGGMWTVDMSPTTKTLYSMLVSGLVVGEDGIVLTQPMVPGMWIAQPYSGTANNLNSIAWNGYHFMAVGDLGNAALQFTMIQSDCGATPGASCGFWKAREDYYPTEIQRRNLYGVAWDGVFFTSVGANGNILDSHYVYSGPSPEMASFYDIAYSGDGSAVAVGKNDGGVGILSSWVLSGASLVNEVGGASFGLYSVIWDGGRFVAVGGSGEIIVRVNRSPPNPPYFNWESKTSNTTKDLYSIVWNGAQFVVVGASGTILTSPNGNTWTPQSSGVTNDLRSVIWTGTQFVTVGMAGTILTSLNGITWTNRTSNSVSQDLYDVSWSGNQLVAVGAGGLIAISDCSWGGDWPLPANQWTQISLPAQPVAGATVQGVFGDDFPGKTYGVDWVLYQLTLSNTYAQVPYTTPDALEMGVGYWIKSLTSAELDIPPAATATPLIPCSSSTVGCFEIPLNTPLSASTNRYNFVGMGLPYPVAWWDARIKVDDNEIYTLSAASEAGYVDKNYWVYNGNGYDVYDDVTPGQIGISQPFQGLWVAVKPASAGHVVKLLLPAIPKLSQAPAPDAPAVARAEPAGFWQRLLDVLIAPAAADPLADTPNAQPAAAKDRDRDRAKGKSERDAHNNAHSRAIQDGFEWYARLIVEDSATGMRDRGNVFGQLADSVTGYDQHDLKELSPFGKPYLTLVFPHPDWGGNAGDYTTDYRSTEKARRGAPAANWRFEIRTDQIGRNLQLRWEGPDAVLSRSVLFDEDTGVSYPLRNPHYAQGIPVAMPKLVHRFTWRYAGKTQGNPGKDD
ncbi:MAG: hypothetical protein WAV07_12200 [Candidatus Contendobacter sp.]